MGYLSDVAIVTVCQHPTFLVPLLRMDLWSIFSSDAKKCQQAGARKERSKRDKNEIEEGTCDITTNRELIEVTSDDEPTE